MWTQHLQPINALLFDSFRPCVQTVFYRSTLVFRRFRFQGSVFQLGAKSTESAGIWALGRMRRGWCMLFVVCTVTLSITADVCTGTCSPSESRIPIPLSHEWKEVRARKEGAAQIRCIPRIPQVNRGDPVLLRLRGGSSMLNCLPFLRKWWKDSAKLGGWRGPRREKEVPRPPCQISRHDLLLHSRSLFISCISSRGL